MCRMLALQYPSNVDPSPWTSQSNPEIVPTYLERRDTNPSKKKYEKQMLFCYGQFEREMEEFSIASNVLLTFIIIPHLYISNKNNILVLRIQDIKRLEVLAMSCVTGKKTYSTKLSKFSSTLRPLPSSYLEIRTWRTEGGIAYPRLYRASLSSVESIFPLRSLSNLSKMAYSRKNTNLNFTWRNKII